MRSICGMERGGGDGNGGTGIGVELVRPWTERQQNPETEVVGEDVRA
jgi:hypothetical protein